MISNIKRLDERLGGLTRSIGISFGDYADDINFCIMGEMNVDIWKFIGMVNRIVKEESFIVNKQKTKFLREYDQQKVLGVTLNNSKLEIPRKWIREFRALIHKTFIEMNQGKLSKMTFDKMMGKVGWTKQVNPERYKRYILAVNDIIKISHNKSTTIE